EALLSRWTGQEDLLVGTPVANRGRGETEGLIGLFVNTLALRGRPEGGLAFRGLLGQAREESLAALARQDLPFERLVEELRPERDLSRPPLFQVMLIHQNAPLGRLELPGLALHPVELPAGTAKFELTLALTETNGVVSGTLEYAAALFDPATVRRLGGHFETLLRGAVEAPEARVADLPLLGPAERRQIESEWHGGALVPPETTLHRLFEEQAARTPEATALVAGETRLTYRELDRRANGLAHRLRDLGAGPERAVGVCLERSEWLVTALLAVLKAGGFYVPLDPAYPPERLAVVAEDSRLTALISRENLFSGFAWSGPLLSLDETYPERDDAPEPLAHQQAEPGNLAYVIYTSGSTGRPKGVAIEHRTAVALVPWSYEVFTDEEMAGVLGSTSINFDMSVFELFVTLARGGTLILAANALELPSLPARGEVTLIDTVPSAIAELVRAGGIPASARTVNLGGEPLSRHLVDSIYGYGTGNVERVVNLYGPSEDTTFSTISCVPRDDRRAPTIGRPLSGAQAWVLDRWMRPVPASVVGELYLGGVGISRGYLHRPEMTAERFIPDPFGPPGTRLYRTGDLVRWLPDGQLEFLGRRDFQVKIRGFRIELGEIEAALAAHPAVSDAVVLALETGDDNRLVAFWVGEGGADPRSWLRRILPDYMVPSGFVRLDALPLTPNGKVDRQTLAKLGATPLDLSGESGATPSTPLEELLAGLWADVLRVERVGVHDDFFELGGHSLLATQIVSRMREALGVELPLRALFGAPTVAALAAVIKEARRDGQTVETPPIVPRPRERDPPLSIAQERLWFLAQLDPESPAYNVPVALRLEGDLDLAAFQRALDGIVRRHEALRTSFPESGGRPVQRIVPPTSVPLSVIDLSKVPEEARRLAAEEAGRPFDLRQGPVVRATLLRLGDRDHVALLTMHHIVSDGWSMGVLVCELSALYAGSPLPALPIQYADYAEWQREWLAGGVLDAQLAWWRERLEGAPAVLELPTDRPRPAVQSLAGGALPLSLPADLSAGLINLARRENATLFMVLLAGFEALLSRWTGQEDLLVGTPVANRGRGETEGLIGLFVNTLALRGRPEGGLAFRGLLGQAREESLAALARQDLPFERLVEELRPDRDLSRPPLFQVMLIHQNAPLGRLELPGLALSPVELPAGTAKFELTLALTETGGVVSGTLEYAAAL
ncbi:MAG: amino acid adenylation domain-containing protein, partial [Thermoanaerobaculia bacterium]